MILLASFNRDQVAERRLFLPFFFFRLFYLVLLSIDFLLFLYVDEDVLDLAFLADTHGFGGCLGQERVVLSCVLNVAVGVWVGTDMRAECTKFTLCSVDLINA